MIEQLAALCQSNQIKIATAESCTGGMVSSAITDLAGSSQWFDAGFVTYSNEAKMSMLGVDPHTLDSYGAVSEPVVIEMAKGAVAHSQAHFAVSISGVAGPGGGTKDKPVGMVCFGVSDGKKSTASTVQFDGDRARVREQSREFALKFLKEFIEASV